MAKIKLSDYNQPIEFSKKISEGYDYVRFGEQDSYYPQLIELYKNAKTHKRCIDNLVQYAYGENGLLVTNADEFPFESSFFLNSLSQKDVALLMHDFRLFGTFAIECITNRTGKAFSKLCRIPMWKVRPESKFYTPNNKINNWYYSEDFSLLSTENRRPRYLTPTAVPAFDGSEFCLEPGRYIYVFAPNKMGNDYISAPCYEAGLNEIETEWEVSAFHLFNVKTGFAGATIVQFNNGEVENDEAEELESRFLKKYAGSRGQRVVFMYNKNKESEASIENIALSDADKLFITVDERTTQGILTAHGVTSKELLGIDTKTGFASNADIMLQAYELMKSTEIRTFQNLFLEGLKPLLDYQGFGLNLELIAFPLENVIKPTSAKVETELELTEEEVKANEHIKNLSGKQMQNLQRFIKKYNKGELTREQAVLLISSGLGISATNAELLLGEKVQLAIMRKTEKTDLNSFLAKGERVDPNEWVEIMSQVIEDNDERINLARVPRNAPDKESVQDNDLFRVRYRYTGSKTPQREFCKKMISADKVFRFEDIQAASSQRVNPGWGPRGADTYDIWLYKGGGNCYHRWERVVYLKADNKKISVNKAQEMIMELNPKMRDSARLVVNNEKVARLPIDMPNRAFLE